MKRRMLPLFVLLVSAFVAPCMVKAEPYDFWIFVRKTEAYLGDELTAIANTNYYPITGLKTIVTWYDPDHTKRSTEEKYRTDSVECTQTLDKLGDWTVIAEWYDFDTFLDQDFKTIRVRERVPESSLSITLLTSISIASYLLIKMKFYRKKQKP